MSTAFVSQEIWPQLTKAVRNCRQRCNVAVAYFGDGASRLVPLPAGSRLVVDASELAVASGQTCPADLIKMVKRGVAVYSVPNLHAKVFVVGRAAYIGSNNVSNHSARRLIEALIRTTDVKVVRTARKFVQDHCLHQLTPQMLQRLAKLYRPPLVSGNTGPRKGTSNRPAMPQLILAQLWSEDWTADDMALYDAGLPAAKKRQEHPRSYELDSFIYTGSCPYRRKDVVIQITDEGDGRSLMSAPGNVLHIRTRRYGTRQTSVVYLERPAYRRRSLKSVQRQLGRGSVKQLKRNGQVRNAAVARSLLNLWAS